MRKRIDWVGVLAIAILAGASAISMHFAPMDTGFTCTHRCDRFMAAITGQQ